MIGGTNGAHLTSFSLIDVLTHGRACAMLNPTTPSSSLRPFRSRFAWSARSRMNWGTWKVPRTNSATGPSASPFPRR